MEILVAVSVVLFLLAGFCAFQYFSMRTRVRELSDELLRVQRESRAEELDKIQYKLNPHLFKNALNSIQSHAFQAYSSLNRLSEVLDYILYESDRTTVSVKEEIEFVLSLVEINRLKLSPLFDLKVKNRIDPANRWYAEKLLSPLITVNLIENAFKHADLQSPDAFISIVFDMRGNTFVLHVSNKTSRGNAISKEHSGFGKTSLQTRLDALYAGRYTLEQSQEKDVYTAHLKIQLGE